MKTEKGHGSESARKALAHLDRIVNGLALPTPAGYWLDPVIVLVILLLYVPGDAKLLRAKEWMQRNPAVKENWDAWTEGHRREKEALGFASVKEHLSAYMEQDLLLMQAFKSKGLLPEANGGTRLLPLVPEEGQALQAHAIRPSATFMLS